MNERIPQLYGNRRYCVHVPPVNNGEGDKVPVPLSQKGKPFGFPLIFYLFLQTILPDYLLVPICTIFHVLSCVA